MDEARVSVVNRRVYLWACAYISRCIPPLKSEVLREPGGRSTRPNAQGLSG
jgi:hypothetical protein